MPAQSRLDPNEVRQKPNIVTDSDRVREMQNEVRRKLRHIKHNYWMIRSLIGEPGSLHRSLIALRNEIDKEAPEIDLAAIHPELQVAIHMKARALANDGDPSGPNRPGPEELSDAAIFAANEFKLPKKPPNRVLRFHVEAVMAVIIEATGKRVTASEVRDGDYDPHLSKGVSEIVGAVFAWIDPKVTTTSLVSVIIDARKRYAKKSMRFDDFFPLRPSIHDPLVPVARDGRELAAFEWIGSI